ncbi:hypothetical protein KR038_001327 [Drosophila bunnanda]|nr:hypothetical protein KR038_001327 [Drosophila bunnanda]
MAQFYGILLILFLASHSQTAKLRLQLMWRSFKCATNPDYVSQYKCLILEADRSLLTTEINYIQDVEKYNATFKLFMPRKPNAKYQKVLDINVDICQFAKGVHGHRFMTVVIKAFGKQGSQLKCPHPKGLYVYPNINIAENLPAFLPETEFRIEMNFLTTETHLVNTTLAGFLYDPQKKRVKGI